MAMTMVKQDLGMRYWNRKHSWEYIAMDSILLRVSAMNAQRLLMQEERKPYELHSK